MREEGEVTLDILHAGGVFGWSCLIEPHVHTATAKAVNKTELIAVDAAPLRFMLERNPSAGLEVMQRLAKLLARRLRAVYSALDVRL
jgi:CRP-like cAMP-binding protein